MDSSGSNTGNVREYFCVHPTFNQSQSFVCVEYPAIVRNNDKMIKSLQGIKTISKKMDKGSHLDLYFRLNDPTSKPVCADPHASNNLVLKVKKYKRKVQSAGGPEEIMYRPEILGIADRTYKFGRLHEFQYLPVQKNTTSGKFESLIPYLGMRPGDITSDLLASDKPVPLLITPATYSRFDKPQNIIFAKKVEHKMNPGEEAKKMGMSRRRRNNNAICWDIKNEGCPTEPLPLATEELKRYTVNVFNGDTTMETTIRKLFEERPIWSRAGVCCLTKSTRGTLLTRRILPVIAFYYCNGPWRGLWVRFGYDPKVEKQALPYQLIEYRVKRSADLPMYLIKPHRPRGQKKKVVMPPQTMALAIKTTSNENDAQNEEQRLNSFKFIPGVLPQQRQTFYQYIDIEIPEVKALIDSHLVQVEESSAVCNIKYGWLSEGTAATVRSLINDEVSKTLKLIAGNPKVNTSTKAADESEMQDDVSSEFEDEEETDVSSDDET